MIYYTINMLITTQQQHLKRVQNRMKIMLLTETQHQKHSKNNDLLLLLLLLS